MIKEENGEPEVSLSNVYQMSVIHGPIVASIHMIMTNNQQATNFFFYDGFAYVCNGFEADHLDENKKQKYYHKILNTIYDINNINFNKLYEEIKSPDIKNKNIIISFSIEEDALDGLFSDNDGIKAFDMCLEFLREDRENHIIREMFYE